MDRLMTAREAADYLHMSFQNVYRLAQRGRVPALKVGGQWRFKRELLDEWLHSQLRTQRSAPQVASSSRAVLVVDDEPGVCRAFAEILGHAGRRVVAVSSGYEALERARHERFDVIFLDVFMPGLNGVDTFKGLRELDPSVRIVLITGYADRPLVAEALELGPVVMLRKPVSVGDIEAVLALLEGRNAVAGVGQ